MKTHKIIILSLSITFAFVTCYDEIVVYKDELKKPPKLTFTKLTTNKEDVTKEQLLQQIKEKEKAGFTIKSITMGGNYKSFVEIKGTAPNFSLKIKKAGTFKITLILQKAGFKDVTIEATIVYLATESLTFDKLITSKNTLNQDDILKQVNGNKKGFTIKSITIGDPYKSFVEAKGTAPDISLKIKKAGDFTATVVLEEAHHTDVTLNASFSGVPQKLTFNKMTTYKKILNKDDIFKQIPEKEKTGYTLKSIVLKDDTFANVTGKAPHLSLNPLKIGTFKADITLSKTGFLDVTIKEAHFNYISANLAFSKILKTHKRTLTKNDIFNQIQGDKTGYTITKIEVTDKTYADVNPADYSLTLKRDGVFTIMITLQKAGYPETKINEQVEYRPKPTLRFDKLTTPKKTITQAEIEKQIQGDRKGYTLKTLAVADSHFATADNNNFTLSLKKTGAFTVTITLQKANYFDVTLNASFEGRPENLTFNPLNIAHRATLNSSAIVAQINGAGKASYTLKSISHISDTSVAQVQGAGSNSVISLKKAGSFTATIVLQRNGYFDVTIPAASFTIQKSAAETLTFKTGFQESFVSGGSFTETEIFSNVQGNKTNYKIKEIKNISPTGIVNLSADKKSLSFVKVGSFTATLVLEHDAKADATITNASFKIIKGALETLTFKAGFQEPFVGGGSFTEAEILNNVQGSKTNYKIKEIKNINPTGVVNLSADKKSLSFLKIGSFTATLVLEHDTKVNVTITNASFEITKGAAETLTFKANFQETFVSGGTFTETEIFNNVQGSKTGYKIKEISNLNPYGYVLFGSGQKSLSFVKPGSFTATIVLEHNTKADATITNASFKIIKSAAETLTFKPGFKETFVSGGTFTEAEIFNNVQGNKTNYRIKEIKNIHPTGIVNLAGDKKSLSFVKVGSFTATLILEHNTKSDATITNASFEIIKSAAETLTFKAGFEENFATGGSFTEAEIFNNVQGNKTGYRIKEITTLNPTGIVNLSSDKKSLSFVKVGSFTATLILEHDTKADATITNARFKIIKSAAETLTFKAGFEEIFVTGGSFTEVEIFSNVQGNKTGYRIKEIKTLNPTVFVNLAANKKSLSFVRAGSFTATLVLEHDTKQDATIVGASFNIVLIDKTFGGANNDVAYSIIQTNDGGYAVAGYTDTGSTVAKSNDFWVLKLDSAGNKLWDKTHGGADNDVAYSIIQTSDGGYAVAGFTDSKGNGNYDFWVLKLDSAGDLVWDKTHGGADNDVAYSIIQTSDGGYVVAGETDSKGSGFYDAWVLRLDSVGDQVWDETYGGNRNDAVEFIIQVSGGYVVAGHTQGNVGGADADADVWVLKLDSTGNKLWDKTYGGAGEDAAKSIIEVSGEYAVAGYTKNTGVAKNNFWVLKLDSAGNKLWDKTFGGLDTDSAYSITQTGDGGYVVAGETESYGNGKFDAWVLKLDSAGNKLWDKTFGGSKDDKTNSIIKTSDGGYAVAGYTSSKGSADADSDVWVLKLDANGNRLW